MKRAGCPAPDALGIAMRATVRADTIHQHSRPSGTTIICGKTDYGEVVVYMKGMARLNASSRRISLKWNTSITYIESKSYGPVRAGKILYSGIYWREVRKSRQAVDKTRRKDFVITIVTTHT